MGPTSYEHTYTLTNASVRAREESKRIQRERKGPKGKKYMDGSVSMSRAETTHPPNKQAHPRGYRAKAGVVSVDSC